jgi:hypothetical protein
MAVNIKKALFFLPDKCFYLSGLPLNCDKSIQLIKCCIKRITAFAILDCAVVILIVDQVKSKALNAECWTLNAKYRTLTYTFCVRR